MIGGKQHGFSDDELTTAMKQTRREKFLSEMEAVVPCQALFILIEPHDPKARKKGGEVITLCRLCLLTRGLTTTAFHLIRPRSLAMPVDVRSTH